LRCGIKSVLMAAWQRKVDGTASGLSGALYATTATTTVTTTVPATANH
jgi:hypothetical protein